MSLFVTGGQRDRAGKELCLHVHILCPCVELSSPEGSYIFGQTIFWDYTWYYIKIFTAFEQINYPQKTAFSNVVGL